MNLCRDFGDQREIFNSWSDSERMLESMANILNDFYSTPQRYP